MTDYRARVSRVTVRRREAREVQEVDCGSYDRLPLLMQGVYCSALALAPATAGS
jgi:hypothetical protein